MDKIKITINGKTFEAEGEKLIDILGDFLNEPNPNDNLPNAYNNYYDYLSIEDFDPSRCSTPDQLKVLKERLNNRLEFTKKHIKDIDLSNVIHSLNNIDDDVQVLLSKVDCIKQSYQAVRNYISNIKKIDDEN